MKKTLRKVAMTFALISSFMFGVFFAGSIRILWTPSVAVWQKTVRTHLAQEAEKLTLEELESVYAEATLRQELRDAKPPTVRSLATLKGWINQYIANDMEPFFRKVVEGLPPGLQKRVEAHATTCSLPKILMMYEPGVGGKTNRQDSIWINPPVIDSYDELRCTLSHELVHYWVQQVHFNASVEIGEGITQYLTVKAFEDLGWSLGFLSLFADEEPEDDLEKEHPSKEIARSIRMLKKHSKTYSLQTNAANILLSLDAENKLLYWYVGQESRYFDPYQHSQQILELQKIAGADARKWIAKLKNNEDLLTDALQEFGSYDSFRAFELHERYKLLQDHHLEKEVLAIYLAKNFDEIELALQKRNFDPMPLHEWNALVASSEKKTKEEIKDVTPARKHGLNFYHSRMIEKLRLAMYADLASLRAPSDDRLQKQLFADLKEDASRSEIVKIVCKRIRLVLFVEAIRAIDWLDADENKEEERAIKTLKNEIDKEHKQFDSYLKKSAILLKNATQHHVEVVELLRNAGTDPLPLFKQRGMPQYFLNQFK